MAKYPMIPGHGNLLILASLFPSGQPAVSIKKYVAAKIRIKCRMQNRDLRLPKRHFGGLKKDFRQFEQLPGECGRGLYPRCKALWRGWRDFLHPRNQIFALKDYFSKNNA